jgi:hypothetical protein
VVLLQGPDEIKNIIADRFDIHGVRVAELGGDLHRVQSLFKQVENFGADDIQAIDPAVVNIEQNSAVLGLGSPHGIGYLEHRLRSSEGMDRAGCNRDHCGTCEERIPQTARSVRKRMNPRRKRMGRRNIAEPAAEGLRSIPFAFVTHLSEDVRGELRTLRKQERWPVRGWTFERASFRKAD